VTGVRTSVYLDDELVRVAKLLDLNISSVLQGALREAIDKELEAMSQRVADGQQAQRRLEELNGLARASAEEH